MESSLFSVGVFCGGRNRSELRGGCSRGLRGSAQGRRATVFGRVREAGVRLFSAERVGVFLAHGLNTVFKANELAVFQLAASSHEVSAGRCFRALRGKLDFAVVEGGLEGVSIIAIGDLLLILGGLVVVLRLQVGKLLLDLLSIFRAGFQGLEVLVAVGELLL